MKLYLFTFFNLFILCGLTAQEKVEFIPQGGVHIGLKEVKLVIPEGFKVYYTKDGTTPNRFSNRVRESLNINGNIAFRFLVYDDKGNKKLLSQSYFTERKHSLPIVSITSDPDNFFDSIKGIYAKGCCADTVDPYIGANFWKDWERPIHFEFIEKDNRQVINQPAGIKIFGGYSVSMRQKSFALFARKKYGDNRFRHPLLPRRSFDKYKNFILRNAGGDMIAAHIRDVYATQLVKETGLAIQEYRPVIVYINGEYWGKYNLREKINEHYVKAHFGYPKDSSIIMRHKKEPQHGSTKDYEKFIYKVPKLDLTKLEDLKYMDSKIDIGNYLLYNICEIYTGNTDAGGNIRYYKHTSDTAKWRWIFYDLDMGLNYEGSQGYKRNSINDFTVYKEEVWPNPPWSTQLIRKLLENDSIKGLYINQFSDLLNTSFNSNRALNLIDSLESEVSDEIDYHLKRWKVPRKRYDKSLNDLRIFAKERPNTLKGFLKERFGLEDSLIVKVIIQKGGTVKLNTLHLRENFVGEYFKDIPLQFEAKPEFDYDFKGWKNLSFQSTKEYQKFNSDTIYLEPIFEKRAWSDYRGNVQVTEVDATQPDDSTYNDWIEIYNFSNKPIDLSGWILKDNKDEHTFTFPEGVVLDSNDFLIVAQDTNAFRKAFSEKIDCIGNLSFGIHKRKDKIRLYDSASKLVDKLKLKSFSEIESDTSNWTKIDYRITNFDGNNWKMEKPSPGFKSYANERLLKQEVEDRYWKSVFLYSGISAGVLVVLLFLFTLLRKRK